MLHFHTALRALHNSQTAPFSQRETLLSNSVSPHSINLTHPHFVLAVTAASHPPSTLILSSRYVNYLTVSTSSHNFFSCSTASQIFPSLLSENFTVTILTPAHLLWIHLPHGTRNTELTFTLKQQTSHETTLLLDKPSLEMPLLTINLVFPRLTFKPMLSKTSFHFKNLSFVSRLSH